jgi:hypothetical protein
LELFFHLASRIRTLVRAQRGTSLPETRRRDRNLGNTEQKLPPSERDTNFMASLDLTFHRRQPTLLAAFALSGALASASVVGAQPLDDASRAAAITLGGSGLDAYDAGRYQEASDMLEKAYVVARVPTLGLWSARALEKLGLWLEAVERFAETARLELAADAPPAHHRAQEEARAELADLQARLPAIVVEIEGAPLEQVRLSFDGNPLSSSPEALKFSANPGHHTLEAQLGTATQVREVSLEPRAKQVVVITFDAPLSENKPASLPAEVDEQPAKGEGWPLRTWGWVSLGAGAAGIAVGTIGLAGALSNKAELEDSGECAGRSCTEAASSLIDSYDSWRTVSTIGFIAGGLFAATGVAVILIDAPAGETQAIIGPGFVGARGSF